MRIAIMVAGFLVGMGQWCGPARGQHVRVDYFRLRTPGDAGDINQASDLHYGRLGERKGLWTACDRNGGPTAGRVYFFSPGALARPGSPGQSRGEPAAGGRVIADDAFTVVPPADWAAFAEANREVGTERLEDVRRRITAEADRGDEPFLDLETITVAPSPAPPHEAHLFAVSEEPFSTVLDLALEGHGTDGRARLLALYTYHERPEEQGTARNDGLEGFAYAGRGNEFYFAEEGTRDCAGRPTALLLFCDPRLGRGRLQAGQLAIEQPASDGLTAAVRALRKGANQTLNGLALLPDGRLLAVDRNGGWILIIDPQKRTARRWLNLYDIGGVSLRELLANFPGERRMPYVSIEGVAVDELGALWLVDDPAMPENFRNSCLVRVSGLDFASRQPAETRPGGSQPAR